MLLILSIDNVDSVLAHEIVHPIDAEPTVLGLFTCVLCKNLLTNWTDSDS